MKKEISVEVIEICPEPRGPHDYLRFGDKGSKVTITAFTHGDTKGLTSECTLSWEEPDPIHQCEEIEIGRCGWKGSQSIRREGDGWWLYVDDDRCWYTTVSVCPGCGEKLR